MAMLEVKDLHVHYGVIEAIKGIDFEVNKGEVIALIGANGAGKTTILHTVTGLIQPTKGTITFEGKDITKTPGYKIVSLGMAHVPEGRRVFAQLSVYENLLMGAYTRKDKEEIENTLRIVYDRFPRLEERKGQMAGTLSGGEQQRVAIARAILNNPRILIFDEATSALDYESESIIQNNLKEICKGRTVLIIAHRLSTLKDAQKIMVIDKGSLVEYDTHENLMTERFVRIPVQSAAKGRCKWITSLPSMCLSTAKREIRN